MMNSQIRSDWCSALRSGEYSQSRYQLRDDRGFCCLGVLCELAVKAEVIPPANSRGFYENECSFLPEKVSTWAGLETTVAVVDQCGWLVLLSSLNDGGMTFGEIADLIEAQL